MLKFASTLIKVFNRTTSIIAMAVLFLMMMITTVDVIGRFVFNTPIQGSFELTQIMLVSIVFCSMAFCQFSRGHISVDIAVRHFGKTTQLVLKAANYVLTALVLVLIAWKSAENAIMSMHSNEQTMILGIPVYPFIFLVALGSTGMLMEVIKDLFSIKQEERTES